MAIRESTLSKYAAIVEVSSVELDKYQGAGCLLSPHIKIIPRDNLYEYGTHIEFSIQDIINEHSKNKQSFRISNYHYQPEVSVEDLTEESVDPSLFFKLFKKFQSSQLKFISGYLYLTKDEFIKNGLMDVNFKLLFLHENGILDIDDFDLNTSFDRLSVNNEVDEVLTSSGAKETYHGWVNFIAGKIYRKGALFRGKERVRATNNNLAFKKFALYVEKEEVRSPPVSIDDIKRSTIKFYSSLPNALSDLRSAVSKKKVDDLNYKAQQNLVDLEDMILKHTRLPKSVRDNIRSVTIDYIIKSIHGEQEESVLSDDLEGVPSYYFDKIESMIKSLSRYKISYISIIYDGVLKI